ncbi:hypothetical protein, partial [Klebsiella pneumoniae]|uniref:hypothetical protein n=1 Tax=Klebsiella pneumoniae TaxID=573 RepID=UPI001CECA03F
ERTTPTYTVVVLVGIVGCVKETGLCNLPLIYSPFLLKRPVLTPAKSLRRSRQAGAARMDAG